MRIIFLIFALFLSLSAEDDLGYSDTPDIEQKILYSSYEYVPKQVFKGQIFPVTIKTLSTEEYFEEIAYKFEDGVGVRLLNEKPVEKERDNFFYHTFYFLATSSYLKTPNVTISLVFSEFIQNDLAFLDAKKIKVVTLNPPKDFVNIIANDFKLLRYKTNHYDNLHNITVFSTQLNFGVIENFKIEGEFKQGFESNSTNITDANMTYYAIIPKSIEELNFSYFNLKHQRFEKIIMPIILDDDTVSTQSNLTPKDHRHTQIKLYIAIAVAMLSLILFILRRRYLYLFITLLAVLYALYISVPIKNVCVKAQTPIQLLPMSNGTIFEITEDRKNFEVEGSIEGYIKVKLQNNKIGWIKNENLCTP
jgi:hypothetical protein